VILFLIRLVSSTLLRSYYPLTRMNTVILSACTYLNYHKQQVALVWLIVRLKNCCERAVDEKIYVKFY